MKDKMYTYCERLKILREGKGWSIQEAATKLGVAKSVLNSYETKPIKYKGKTTGRKAPLKFLLDACDVYGVTLDYLCGRSDIDAPTLEEEDVVKTYGLSSTALGILREFYTDGNINNKLAVEFINVLIESTKNTTQASVVANRSLDYIVGAHKSIFEQEELVRRIERAEKKGESIIPLLNEPYAQRKELDYREYQLSKEFGDLMKTLARKNQQHEQIKKLYEDNGIPLPNYKDDKPHSEWRRNDPIKVYFESTEDFKEKGFASLDDSFTISDDEKVSDKWYKDGVDKGSEILEKEKHTETEASE